MQTRPSQRRIVTVAGIWALATLTPCVQAQAPRRTSAKAESRTAAVEGILASQDPASRLRALARSARPEAATELAVLAASPDVASEPRLLLQAIRALARFASEPAAEQALLHHLRSPHTDRDSALRTTARATAAIAVARAGRPAGLRVLLLLASGPEDGDAELARIAQSALDAYPPAPDSIARALPWLRAEERTRLWADLASSKRRNDDAVRAACRAAKERLRSLPELSTPAAAALIGGVARCPAGFEPSPQTWLDLGRLSETWALRGLAASGKGLEDATWLRRAQAALQSDESARRAAAAWFLALASPERAERLAEDPRPEVRAAARNQRLANAAASGASYPDCSGPRKLSTSTLFSRFTAERGEGDPLLLGCLASRLTDQPDVGLTSVELEALFSSGSPRTRLAIALGLANAEVKHREQAYGLVQRLYAAEADAYIRRSLCIAAGTLAPQRAPTDLPDFAVDPDPVCRAVGGARSATLAGTRVLTAATSRGPYWALRVLAPPLALEPAPDGFVGARVAQSVEKGSLRLDFVDCSESAGPTWACGQGSQTPR